MTLWIDLSDFMDWNGQFTGIHRVMWEVARRFAQEEQDTRFFVFVRGRGFSETEFSAGQSHHWGDVDSQLVTVEKTTLLKRAARRFVPLRARAFVARVRGRNDGQGNADAIKAENDIRPEETSIFSQGDTVLVIGSSWHYGVAEALRIVRSNVDIKVAHFIHDIIPIKFPQFFWEGFSDQFEAGLRVALSCSDVLICVSKNSANDVAEFEASNHLAQLPKQIIRLGDTELGTNVQPVEGLLGSEPFVLAVGTVEVRKNHAVLYNAWVWASINGVELPRLVIVGREGWLAHDVYYQMRVDPRVRERIVFLSDLNDEQLAWLYEASLLVVYPSLYEGWGLPVAEALTAGKVCITSDVASIPEIGGSLVDYADPYSPSEYANRIASYSSNQVDLEHREVEIHDSYKVTDWSDTYLAVKAITNSL